MDSAPGMELYDSYNADLQQLLSSVSQRLESDASEGQRVEQRRAVYRRIEMELEEADEIVAQMEIEVQGFADRSAKSKAQVKIRSYKADLAKRKADIKTQLSSLNRTDLLGSFATDDSSAERGQTSQAQRGRLLTSTDKLHDSSRRLEESHRLALETEDLGANILGNLRGQREQILSTRDRLQDADRGIGKASGTLGKMIRRMYQQRVVVGLLISVLVILMHVFLFLAKVAALTRLFSILVIWSKFR